MLLVLALLSGVSSAQDVFPPSAAAFAEQVNVAPLARLGVHHAGRVMLLDSFARQQLRLIVDQESPQHLPPTFAYFELLLNARAYLDQPIMPLEDPALRRALTDYPTQPGMPGPTIAEMMGAARLAPRAMLEADGLTALSDELRTDASERLLPPVVTAQQALAPLAGDPKLRRALEKLESSYIAFIGGTPLRIVPPLDSGHWRTLEDLPLMQHDLSAGSRQEAQSIYESALRLAKAWRARDAKAANAAIDELAGLIRQANPDAQPRPAKATAELVYNRGYRFTVVWIGYALAFLALLFAIVRPRPWLRRLGLGLMVLSTVALAAGFAIRWWLSGRPWYLPPVTGQFESVLAAALLGAVLSLVLEAARPRNYFALGASFFAVVSLLCGFLLPQAMRADIVPAQGILNNWILPLHVGTIILGYAMIGVGLVISVIYLAALGGRRHRAGRWSSSPDLSSPAGDAGLLADLDRCNLIVAQLACLLVGLGTILGAYWADYSWGRWWGFDPKEVWALITWIVYLAVVHVRAVSGNRRGLWTAGLTLAGAAVMLFNWVIVKYFLPSLHSYA